MPLSESQQELRAVLATVADKIGLGDRPFKTLEVLIEEGTLNLVHHFRTYDTLPGRASFEVDFVCVGVSGRFSVEIGYASKEAPFSVTINWCASGELSAVEAVAFAEKQRQVALLACQVHARLQKHFTCSREHWMETHGNDIMVVGAELEKERTAGLATLKPKEAQA